MPWHNDLKKYTTPQKIAWDILKLTVDVSEEGKRDVVISETVNRSHVFNAKVQKVNEFLSEMKTRKNI